MSVEYRYPDFIIGGAPKSGTSSLYFWLSSHPNVCGAKVKEPYFFDDKVTRFNEQLNYMNHSLEEYAGLFAHCDQSSLAFEATAGYLYADNAIKGFLELPSPPKVIFLLRHPSGQLYSHYRMSKYRLNREVGELAEYAERTHVQKFWKYSLSVEKWLASYPKDKMLFMTFEDLMSNKKERMKDICDFLEINSEYYSQFDFEHRNKSVAIQNKRLHEWGLRLQRYIPHGIQRALLPIYMKLNASEAPGKSPADLRTLNDWDGEFRKEIERLKELLPSLRYETWEK